MMQSQMMLGMDFGYEEEFDADDEEDDNIDFLH